MKYIGYDITFTEIVDEVSLAFWISNCRNNCAGCSMPELREDIGEELTIDVLKKIVKDKGRYVDVILFMGGDSDPYFFKFIAEVEKTFPDKKIGLYSGRNNMDSKIRMYVDYYKIGQYIEKLGGLDKITTNQRMFMKEDGLWVDITWKFRDRITLRDSMPLKKYETHKTKEEMKKKEAHRIQQLINDREEVRLKEFINGLTEEDLCNQ